MIRYLSSEVIPGPLHADIVIVGAGIAGLIIADRCAAAGRRVVVLESGGLHQLEETHPLNATQQVGQYYRGADTGRYRCLGGTSTRWGGALIPFREDDCRYHVEGWNADWLDLHTELLSRLGEAEDLFALPRSPYSADDVPAPVIDGKPAFVPRLAKWPSFSKRNVSNLLKLPIAAVDGPEVWLNATVTDLSFDPNGNLASLTARSLDGGKLTAQAPLFLLAAGAIECARLLLLADRKADNRLFAPHDVLGRYFHDHVADTVGQFSIDAARRLNQVSGFRFEAGGMRNLRFEPSEQIRRDCNLPAGFTHISFSSTGTSPFDGLRKVMRALQRKDVPAKEDLRLLFGATGWLMRAAWWRLVKKRLLYPDKTILTLDVVIEQEPRRDSRIDLSDQTDVFGNPIPRIDWRVSSSDRDHIVRMADVFARAWSESPLARMAKLELSDQTELEESASQSGGIFHPGGCTRLGKSARDGVVDRDLRTFGIPNLTVVSTSVFPTGGGANPTMMLIMAAIRAADRLISESKK